MIEAHDLSKAFGEMRALAGLTLTVSRGEIFGLVGPDGAGKTTALRVLAGILRPDGGSAAVAGFDAVRDPSRVQDRIGYMSQRFGLYADLTVGENLAFYADLYGVPMRELAAREERLLGFSGLLPFRRRAAGDLSGGMKQKLGLACALVHTPEVLLLDEPTNGVDPVSRRDFWEMLYRLKREGVTLLVSTAYLDEAERCDRVGLMHGGRLVASGAPRALKARMPGALLEVRTPQVRAAASALREAFPAWSVGLFGDRLHAAVPEAEGGGEALERALRERGIGVDSLRVVAPSLEDLFLALLKEGAA